MIKKREKNTNALLSPTNPVSTSFAMVALMDFMAKLLKIDCKYLDWHDIRIAYTLMLLIHNALLRYHVSWLLYFALNVKSFVQITGQGPDKSIASIQGLYTMVLIDTSSSVNDQMFAATKAFFLALIDGTGLI